MGTGLVGPWHSAVIFLVVPLVFGPKNLPELGRSLGKGLRELTEGISSPADALNVDRSQQQLPAAPPTLRERDTI